MSDPKGLPPHMMIRASAGTGKTFRLVHHYLGLMARGAEPWQIVAATFTRAAAAEITDRLVTRLARACDDASIRAELVEHAGAPVLDRPAACRTLLAKLVRNGHRLQVGTIDSVFARFAQGFALDLGLPAGWRMANRDDPADARLLTDAVARLLEQHDPQTLPELIRLMSRGNTTRSVSEHLRREMDRVHGAYRDALPEAWNWLPEPVRSNRASDGESLLDRLGQVACPTTKAGTPDSRWRKELERMSDTLAARDWEAFCTAGIPTKVIAGEEAYHGHPIPPAVTALVDQVAQHLRAQLLTDIRRQTGATHALVQSFDGCRDTLIAERALLRFDDITHALARAEVTGQAETILYRLDASVHHLLLDEFQDTSVMQWNVLRPLAEELLSYADTSRGLFIVGDPKQSIYGWRGGEPELFNAIADRHEASITPDTLRRSYRSAQPVIDAVNQTFHGLADSGFVDLDAGRLRPGVEAWCRGWADHETARNELPGHAALLATPPEDKQHNTGSDEPLNHAAELIRTLVRRAPHASIGVLVRQNKTVTRMRYLLQRGEPSITASGLGGTPLSDSPAVALVLSLLTMADHPGDLAARYHIATSPLGDGLGFTDYTDTAAALKLSQQVRRRLLIDGYAGTVQRWAERLSPHITPRDADRLMRLVERAMRSDTDSGLRPTTFVRAVRAERQPEPSADRVQVMTIHQSKGLEFDTVVLPELDGSMLPRGGSTFAFERERVDGPITRIAASVSRSDATVVSELDPLLRDADRRSILDAVSGLYVAMTRARHALYMLVPGLKPGKSSESKSPANLLRMTLGASPVPPEADENEADVPACCTTLWTQGDALWYDDLPPPRDELNTATTDAYLAFRLDEPEHRQRHLQRRTPSEHQGETVDLGAILEPRPEAALSRGSVIHALFEQIEWLSYQDMSNPGGVAERAAASCRIADEQVRPHLHGFTKMIGHDAIAAALREPADDDEAGTPELWRERRFIVSDPNDPDALIEGVFDRVVVWRDADGKPLRARVLDFKTDRVSGPEQIDERARGYRDQVGAYRRALRAMLKLPEERIGAALLFVEPGVAVDC